MSGPEPRLEFPEELNIAERLCAGSLQAGWGERPAFLCGEDRLTYRQVADRTARWGGVLEGLGIEPEQRVLLALPDAPAFPVAFLGTLWAGSVAVPVNPYLEADRIAFFLRDSRARVAVVAPWLVQGVLEAAPELPYLRHLVVSPEPGAPEGDAAAGSWRRTRERHSPTVADGRRLLEGAEPAAAAPTHRDEPAFWLYTSGSTGLPKAAVHLHHDIGVAAECWGRCTLGLTPEAVHLSASKLFFAYGLGNSLYCPMWTGGRALLVPDKPDPDNMVASLAAHRVTHFYAVPSFYSALLRSQALEEALARRELFSLKVCVSAGEALPAPLCREWMERTGVPLLDGIGSTELLHIFIANRTDDVRPGASGRPVVGYEARVVREDGGEAATDEVGDLWVKGDSACAYYWNRHAASKRAIRGDWFVTGDKYRQDAEGYFWYAGRSDDMFKVHGQWVSPPEVESVLLEHPAVQEAAVVCGVGEDGVAEVVAHVVVGEGVSRERLPADLLRHAAQRLPSYRVPGKVLFRSSLPKTATGKIQRFRLRREAAEVPSSDPGDS